MKSSLSASNNRDENPAAQGRDDCGKPVVIGVAYLKDAPEGTSSAALNRHEMVGCFTDAAQREPEYDPPHDGPCLVCWQPLAPEDVRTISLVPAEPADVAVFFRVHRTCAESDPGAVEEIEHRIIEEEFRV